MNYNLIVKPEAELDILRTAQWYEKKQQDLGLRFLDEVEEKLDWIGADTVVPNKRMIRLRIARRIRGERIRTPD